MEGDDYLFRLLQQRVRFLFHDESGAHQAQMGIPFGAAIACLFANIYLTDLDREMARIRDVHYFRYADDLLVLSPMREAALRAQECLEQGQWRNCACVSRAASRPTCCSPPPRRPTRFLPRRRNFGTSACSSGQAEAWRSRATSAARFRTSFALLFAAHAAAGRNSRTRRRGPRRWWTSPWKAFEQGVRNVAILDYYLKHVDDEAQLRRLDRWLAEEVLSHVFGGHRKGPLPAPRF